MPTREHIVSEIRRTAASNGDVPLGKARFRTETGIRESDWIGRYWTKWSEALREAGFEGNAMTGRSDDGVVLRALAIETRRLGRLPTSAEMRMARRRDPAFPSHNVFSRFGSRPELVRLLRDYCEATADLSDVSAVLPEVDDDVKIPTEPQEAREAIGPASDFGFVYLLRSGRYFKIGLTMDVEERVRRLKIQLPEAVREVHRIATDDPRGIERYWHDRFADRRLNGEWFELSPDDVAAFRRRRFM